jgi:hypothetical protein
MGISEVTNVHLVTHPKHDLPYSCKRHYIIWDAHVIARYHRVREVKAALLLEFGSWTKVRQYRSTVAARVYLINPNRLPRLPLPCQHAHVNSIKVPYDVL